MKVKGSARLNSIAAGVLAFLKRHSTLLIAFFLLYNLVLVGLGIGIFHYRVPEEYKQKIQDRISIAKIPANFFRGQTTRPDKLHIDIKHKHLRKLAYIRSVSLQRGFLYDTEENSVPATIRFGGESYRVELNVKGALPLHWEDEEMFSMKVKVKGDHTILGMKSFALQHPRARGYLNEWILHELFREADIINLRYEFLSVDINGNPSRIYALEEGFEKRLLERNRHKESVILKYESDFHSESPIPPYDNIIGIPQDLWSSKVVALPMKSTLSDPNLHRLFNKERSLLEAFRQDQLSTSEVFDLQKFATFFAMAELFGSHHPCSLDNIRFYYNPITSLIEPIIHDNDHLDRLGEYPLLGEEKLLGKDIQRRPNQGWWKLTSWYESVFKDPAFYRAYIRALEKIADQGYLDDFFARHEEEIQEQKRILHHDYPILSLNPQPIIYQNQAYIRQALSVEHLLEVRPTAEQPSSTAVQLSVVNTQPFPVEIVGYSVGDAPMVPLAGELPWLQARIPAITDTAQLISLELPEDADSGASAFNALKVHCRILGASRVIAEPLILADN